jgi:CBS domain containing-hemolysin-like protein
MQTLYILGFGIFVAMLVLVASMMPRRSVLSAYELERRRGEGNGTAADELKREQLLEDVLSVKQVAGAVVMVWMVMTSLASFGVVFGVIAAVGVALVYGRIAKFDVVHSIAMRIYETIEPGLLKFLDTHPMAGRVLRTVNLVPSEQEISSREELEHMVEASGHMLTGDEKKLIVNGLHFAQRTVESVMTPRGVVDTIAKEELIGPLALDDLHKTGHSRFPVIDGDIDHVIGVLHIKELLTSFDHKSETAAEAMEKKVFYINQDQTLDHALAAFLKTRHHLFVVVNGYRETAGILTLEDVVEALLGREIVDEYDLHDDLRAVAARSARTNNDSPHGTNV